MRRALLWLTAASTCLATALCASPAAAQRKPYLQLGTPSSVTVVWTSASATPSEVRYGPSPDDLSESVSLDANVTQHEVTVADLEPNKRYYYAIGDGDSIIEGGDADHYFDTSPLPGSKTKFRAWIVGDSGTGDSEQAEVREAMFAYTGVYRPDLYLHMGDMAYNAGTTSEFSARFFTPYETVLRNTVTWPTLGNHEGSSSDSGAQSGPYYVAYVLPRAGEAGGVPSGTEAYYSFDYANVHFIVLDSHDSPREPGGAMLTWLNADLQATSQDWIVAYWHHPPYTKGTHDSDSEGQLVEMRENALPILEAGGVDLVLAGHSHIYERSWLVDGAYDTPTSARGRILDSKDGKVLGDGPYLKSVGNVAHNGAVYVVAGHGGASTGGPANHPLMYFSEKQHGSCILDVQDNRLSLVNIRHDGAVTDRVALIKGPGIVVGAPDGGERLAAGVSTDIRWATVGSIPNVKIEYSLDDGGVWTTLADSTPNTGTFPWIVPAIGTTRGLVRVSNAANASVQDESNAGFVIADVPIEIVPYGSTWRYQDEGADQGSDWPSSSFDDGTWKEGPAQLGYGDRDEATLLIEAEPAYPSAYFRKVVDLDYPVKAASLAVLHDDGVAVFVNGTQVFSKYVDNGVDYASFASSSSEDNEVSVGSIDLATNPFVVGPNVVAAIVKQGAPDSSDVSFDLKLEVTLDIPPPEPMGGMGGGGAGGSVPGTGTGGESTATGSGASSAGADQSDGCGCNTSSSEAPWHLGVTFAGLGALAALLRASRRAGGGGGP